MANTKSAIKRMRQNERRRARNRAVRSRMRTFVKRANTAIVAGEEDAAEAVRAAISELDRAAQKGVIHRNNAARRKSRLMKKLHAAG
ncbi:MAG TPA: 30S ribosomal protein S20 [Chloroflexi bacterium]|nr:30S ribosomal protein S20 [Chloroflexota bacterium]